MVSSVNKLYHQKHVMMLLIITQSTVSIFLLSILVLYTQLTSIGLVVLSHRRVVNVSKDSCQSNWKV